MQKSSRIVTHSGSEAAKAHTLSSCSVKHLQDQFLCERQEADAITQPLLDTENGFIKDLEHYLNHRDMLSLKKRELLHKRWTECVWRPVQCSIKRRVGRGRCEGAEPSKMTHTGYEKCRSTRREDAYQLMEQSRNERVLQRGSRSPGPVYITVDDGRCFRPECWSSIGLSRSYSVKS